MPPESLDVSSTIPNDVETSPLQQDRRSYVGADRMLPFGPPESVEPTGRKSFVHEFAASKGPPQIVILIMLLALGLGSTIGVVRISDGYDTRLETHQRTMQT